MPAWVLPRRCVGICRRCGQIRHVTARQPSSWSLIAKSDKLYDKGRRVQNVFPEPIWRERPVSNKIFDLSVNGERDAKKANRSPRRPNQRNAAARAELVDPETGL